MFNKKSIVLTLALALSLGGLAPVHSNEALLKEIQLKNPESEIINFANNAYFIIKQITHKHPSLGTVIIVHDQQEHADWPELIHPLRTKLTSYGWNTLSVQFPQHAENDADTLSSKLNSYTPELRNALQKHLTGKLVLISKGENSHHIAEVFSDILGKLSALVIISHSEDKSNPSVLRIIKRLSTTPMLDIYAQNDRPEVIETAAFRMKTVREYAQTAHAQYQQIIIPSANHNYSHHETTLIKRIAGWLKRNAQQPRIAKPIETKNGKSED